MNENKGEIRRPFAQDGPHRYFLCVIFLVVVMNIFLRLNFLPLTISQDSESYIGTAQLLSGEEAKAYPGRLLKPLLPLGIALLVPLFGGDMVAGFLALNILCYFLLALAIYGLLMLFSADRFLVMLGTLVFISAYPVLNYGLDLYSEMGAWSLFVLALIGAVRYHRDASWKNFYMTVFAIVIGLLWKEYSLIAGIFFGLILLFEPTHTWREKFFRIALLGACAAFVVGAMASIVYANYHYTYVDWLRDAASVDPAQSQYALYFIAKSLAGVFLLGFGLALAGLWHWRSIPRGDRGTLLLLFPPSMMFLLWTFVSSRLYYVVAPFLAILALHGLRALSERRLARVSLVAVVLFGNYAWLFASGIVRTLFQ